MVISNTLFCLRFFYFIYKLILTTLTQHEYIFSLIRNVIMLTFKMLRQQHSNDMTDEWVSLRDSPIFCGPKFVVPIERGLGNGGGTGDGPETLTSCQMLNHLKFELSRPDAFYLVFLILTVMEKIYRVLFVVLIFKMVPVHWQRHFVFDWWWRDVLEKWSFF